LVLLGSAKSPPTSSTTQTLKGVLSATTAGAAGKRKSKVAVLGRGSTTIASGKTGRLTVTLTRAALKVLAKHGSLTVTETIVAKGPGGTQTITRALTLRKR